jgi:hemerythrin-like domain-containing protein
MSGTAAMAVPISAWHTDHVYFNELLGHLRRELDLFHRGERPDYERMCEVVTYLREYGDAVHHPREGVAFACLAKHCPDMALPLARLEQEHRVIAQAGQALLEQVEAILGGAIVPRAQMEAALATNHRDYGNHNANEEEDVLTRAAKHLTAEDWIAVGRAAPTK